MARSKPPTPGTDAKKLVAKLARSRATASGYETVINAGALLAMSGANEEALDCLQRVWACPESVHRLLVVGKDPKASSFATWLFKMLGAWSAPSDVAQSLAVSKRELLADVRREEARRRAQLDDYLGSPKDYEDDRRTATKRAVALLESMARAKDRQRFAEASAAGRELLELEASVPYHGRLRAQIVADLAFAAGEREESYAVIQKAAGIARGLYGNIYDGLDVLLSFEWSARALVAGDLDLPPMDPGHRVTLREAIDGFFARVAEPPTDEGLAPLLRKLAGARGLRKGATSDEIQALESRLGVKLPPSYTRFLGITNGLRKGKNSLAFLPTSKVAWFRDVDRAWIAAYRDEGADVPHLEDALRIAGPHDGEVYLLNPRVKTKSGEWEAWRFSNHLPGETRYASLRALLESLADGD